MICDQGEEGYEVAQSNVGYVVTEAQGDLIHLSDPSPIQSEGSDGNTAAEGSEDDTAAGSAVTVSEGAQGSVEVFVETWPVVALQPGLTHKQG